MPDLLTKSNTRFMTFDVAQVKYLNYLHRLIWHAAAAHGYVTPRLPGLL